MKQPEEIMIETTETIENPKKANIFLWIPVAVLFCVIPFVIRYALFESRLAGFAWTPINTLATDFHLYYKQIIFVALAGITLLFLYGLVLSKNQDKAFFSKLPWKPLALLGVYLLFTILASLTSEYRQISLTGCNGQFESMLVICGYIICFLYLFLLIQTEKDLVSAVNIIKVSCVLFVVLGLLQATGNNPIDMEWFQKIITPEGYLESGATVTSVFGEDNVSLFAYNPNYAGVLLSMLSIFCFGMLITEKKSHNIIVGLLLLILLLVCLLGTGSKAGLLVLLAVAVLSAIFRKMEFLRKWYLIIPACTMVIMIGLLYIQAQDNQLLYRLQDALNIKKQEPNPLSEMVTGQYYVDFTYNDVSFTVSFDYTNSEFHFYVEENGKGIPLILSENQEVFYLDHEKLEDVTIRPGILNEVLPLFVIRLNGREWMFVKDMQEGYLYLNQFTKLEHLSHVERFGFQGYERLASGRGFLWSMTLPLLKDTVLLGTGADTFACYFPQNNYKDLYYYMGDAVASSRPHSMYLKIAVESGVLALCALLAFFGWYMVQSFCLYKGNQLSTPSERIGYSCFLAVLVYLVAGLTNDSMITVAPVFWGLLAIGMAANRLVKEESSTI